MATTVAADSARVNGAYARASNLDVLTVTLDGLTVRFGLAGERLGEVTGGAVLKHSRDRDLTRERGMLTHRQPGNRHPVPPSGEHGGGLVAGRVRRRPADPRW
jgi:hypothetical protein